MEEKVIIIFLLQSFPSGNRHQNTGSSSWITRILSFSGKSLLHFCHNLGHPLGIDKHCMNLELHVLPVGQNLKSMAER